MVAVNGWELFAHPLFLGQLEKLTAAVERVRKKDPRRLAQERQREALGRAPQARVRDDPRRSHAAGIPPGRDARRRPQALVPGEVRQPGGSACSSATAPRRRSSSSRGSMTRQRCAPMGRRRTLMRCSARCSTRAIRRMTGRRSWKRPPARGRGSGRRRQIPLDKGILLRSNKETLLCTLKLCGTCPAKPIGRCRRRAGRDSNSGLFHKVFEFVIPFDSSTSALGAPRGLEQGQVH